MKKFLGILVLCLLWNSVASSQEKYTSQGGVKIKSTSKDFIKYEEQHNHNDHPN